jgi:hypothetical protein
MFAFDRSALAVLLPLALLLAVVVSSRSAEAPAALRAQSEAAPSERAPQDHTVAANLPSR